MIHAMCNVKQKHKCEEKEFDKPCKFHVHGYQCYEVLKWDYCPYLHPEELRNIFILSQDKNVTAEQLLKALE